MGHAGTSLCHAEVSGFMAWFLELIQFIGCSFLWFLHLFV